jgi:hypothetical protein
MVFAPREKNQLIMRTLYSVFILSVLFFSLHSCTEKSASLGDNAKARLEIRLTDAPLDVDAVNIDIQDVKVNFSTDSINGWQSLSGVKKGVYNLLDLVNDKDTLLASAEIPTGMIHQLRLVLGSNNQIVVDGQDFPLQTPSAQQSGLKLNIQQEVKEGILYKIVLDFDAARSVVKTGNGKYLLKPVISTQLQSTGGTITGVVKPADLQTQVLRVQGVDTLSTTYTNVTGNYTFKGVAAGSYDLHFIPGDTAYKKATKTGVVVVNESVTRVDTVQLTK